MQYRQIEIDVEANRWLEGKRISLDQTHNDILRVEAGLPWRSPRSATAADLTSSRFRNFGER